jgi:tetratricopeptide (TPR) repeat protein
LFAAFVSLLFPLFVSNSASCQTSQDQIAEHFRAGQIALSEGEFSRATEEFKKVLALDPTLVEAEVNLGLAYQSLFEYDLAVRHLTIALRERANLLAPNVIVGMDYVKLGFADKAAPFLRQALKLDPSNREAHEAFASFYLVQNNFRGAAKEFRELAALNSDKSEAWFKLGHEYLDLSARLAYRGAHLYRESAWGHRFLGDLLFQRSRWNESAKEYLKALAIEPQQRGLHSSLGHASLHGDHLDQAEAEFRDELKLDSRSELAWLGLAELALKQGQTSAAAEDVMKAWNVSPEFVSLQKEFPSIELTRDVAKTSVTSLQSSPDGPPKHFLLAALYSSVGETASADEQWKAFQSDVARWQNTQMLKETGQEACGSHRYSACAHWLETLKLLTDSQRLLLGKTKFTLRQYDSAADALAEVKGVNKLNAEAIYWLSRTYQALGTESYARLEESFPNSWRAHQLRAEGAALRTDYSQAAKDFQLALEIRPDSPELHEALGELDLDTHSDADAQRELEKALTLDGSRAHALYLLGRLYVQNHQNEEAIPYLQKALLLQPDLSEASSLLGTAYVRLGNFAEAIPKLQNAAPFDHYGNVHYQLYVAYKKLGQADLAQKALARSQDLRRSSLEQDQAVIMGAPQVGNEAH